jgi:hypothetical protein
MANLLNVTPELLREFLAHLSKPDDETVTLYADGPAVEIKKPARRGDSSRNGPHPALGPFPDIRNWPFSSGRG